MFILWLKHFTETGRLMCACFWSKWSSGLSCSKAHWLTVVGLGANAVKDQTMLNSFPEIHFCLQHLRPSWWTRKLYPKPRRIYHESSTNKSDCGCHSVSQHFAEEIPEIREHSKWFPRLFVQDKFTCHVPTSCQSRYSFKIYYHNFRLT